MKKLFLVLLAGALFVACGNKAEEATEEAVVEEETTVIETAKKAGKNIAKEAIKKGEEEAFKAIDNAEPETPQQTVRRR